MQDARWPAWAPTAQERVRAKQLVMRLLRWVLLCSAAVPARQRAFGWCRPSRTLVRRQLGRFGCAVQWGGALAFWVTCGLHFAASSFLDLWAAPARPFWS